MCGLSILLVKVKSTKGNYILRSWKLCHVLLRTSNVVAEYCRQNNQLPAAHNGERNSPVHTLSGLEVYDLDSNYFYILPNVITQKRMSGTAHNMVTPEDLAKWPYLLEVHIPRIKATLTKYWNIGRSLIAMACMACMLLGWCWDGSLMVYWFAMANRIAVCKLEEMLTNQYNHDFNERTMEEKEMSRENLKFLKTAVFQDGKHCLNLPFKREIKGRSIYPTTLQLLSKGSRM